MEKTLTLEEWSPMKFNGELPYNKTDMIEFAKIQVAAALKSALENAEIVPCGNPYDPEDDSVCVDAKSILNSYPLENIK